MNTHNLITCPECNGEGGHIEILDNSTRQQTGVMCEECYGSGVVLTTENTLPATIDSAAFVEVLGDYARNPSIENGMKVLHVCDTRLREQLAAMYYLTATRYMGKSQSDKDAADKA